MPPYMVTPLMTETSSMGSLSFALRGPSTGFLPPPPQPSQGVISSVHSMNIYGALMIHQADHCVIWAGQEADTEMGVGVQDVYCLEERGCGRAYER